MLEFIYRSSWNRIEEKKSFVPTSDILKYTVESLIRTAEYNVGLPERLLELAHQKPKSEVEFKVTTPEKIDGVFNVSVDDDGRITPIFTIGFGTTSVFYVNKFTQTDKMIYKSKLRTEITSAESLLNVVRDFIMLEPTKNEVVDISREALERKMNERKMASPVSFDSFKR